MTKKASPKKSRFVVSFTVEVEYKGKVSDALLDVEETVMSLVDGGWDYSRSYIKGTRGVKITDATNCEAEPE